MPTSLDTCDVQSALPEGNGQRILTDTAKPDSSSEAALRLLAAI